MFAINTQSASIVYGLAAAVVVAMAALYAGEIVPALGGAPAALLLGILVRASVGEAPKIEPGASWAGKRLLQFAIVLLGAGMSLAQLWALGPLTFALIVAVVFVSLGAVSWIGGRMRLPAALSTLIAVGTAICGASAVAAASPVVRAKKEETAYAISTIFTFNLIALVVYPIVGHAFNLPPVAYAVWAGAAVHDTASAVAAGYAFGDEAGLLATVVKLARTTLLVPVLFILAAIYARKQDGEAAASPWSKFPWFIGAFVAVAIARSAGLIPDAAAGLVTQAAKFLIIVALAGVGLGTDLGRVKKAGYRPLALGLVASALISAFSLALALQLPAAAAR